MKKLWLIFFFIPFLYAGAQSLPPGAIVSGPMLGQVEMRTAKLWMKISSDVTSVSLIYWKEGHNDKYQIIEISDAALKKSLTEFNPKQFEQYGLDFNTHYQYQFILNKVNVASGSFQTKDLWQWGSQGKRG